VRVVKLTISIAATWCTDADDLYPVEEGMRNGVILVAHPVDTDHPDRAIVPFHKIDDLCIIQYCKTYIRQFCKIEFLTKIPGIARFIIIKNNFQVTELRFRIDLFPGLDFSFKDIFTWSKKKVLSGFSLFIINAMAS